MNLESFLLPPDTAFGLFLFGEEQWPQGMGRTGGELETGEVRVGKILFG